MSHSSARRAATLIALVLTLAALAPASVAGAGNHVSRQTVETFQPAGEYGGGVLTPGTLFAPVDDDQGRLHRYHHGLKAKIDTSGLPAGAYTVWWVVFHNPEHCEGPCDGSDLFREGVGSSIFWATGGVVDDDGEATFRARYRTGDDRGTPGEQVLIDGGEFDPLTAEVHNVIKYHGPASSDPEVLEAQTTTALGSCFEGANAHWYPTGVRCADLQVVRHPAGG